MLESSGNGCATSAIIAVAERRSRVALSERWDSPDLCIDLEFLRAVQPSHQVAATCCIRRTNKREA